MRPGEALPTEPSPAMPTLRGGEGATIPLGAPPSLPPVRYQLGQEIARGGMGRVVEATDTTLGRVVALKEALSLDTDTLRRFQREIRITARLEHPSIVPVHDGGIGPSGAPYYVMRKISGRPLEKLVITGESLNQRLALVPHIVAAAQAIAHAHARGIVHRDIKPANILVGDLGETIVIDWGLAKVIGEADEVGTPMLVDPSDSLKTRAGIVYGTPGFMAPEQLRGQPVDPRCDVYALGATLYHLLSRKPPHHAKTADEMMRAAVTAPPTPIGELVTGVPPELSTIIDKALAHAPSERYQDARALAEDLNRFLTGQLVASHHYSTRERVVRFVRKHRGPVMSIAGALLVLLVFGTIMFARIVKERDRADANARSALEEKRVADEERARAQKKADDLTLSQARIVADTNPTLAVAMVKPLAAQHWREARAIGAAARAAGVAWSLPASPTTLSLELSRDGARALSAGDDGVVRIYDLAQRSTRTLVETRRPMFARFADQERRVVLWQDRALSVVDVASGDHHELQAPTPIVDLEVVGITAYWIDQDSRLWQLDLAGAAPLQLPLDEAVRELAPSPDGRWIALAGASHLLLLDRTQPAAPPIEVTPGVTKHMAWSSTGGDLSALVDQSVIDVQLAPTPNVVHRLTVGDRYFVAISGIRMFTIGPTGVAVVSRDDSKARKQLLGDAVGLREARGGTIVAGSQGVIAVLSDHGDHALTVPTGRISMIQASPASPYVLATLDHHLLVWNLDEVEPRAIANQGPAIARFIGSDRVLASFADGPARSFELATGKVHELGQWPPVSTLAAAPDGQLAAVVDVAHHARLVAPGREPEDLGGGVDLAGFATDHELLLGNLGGSVQLYDTTTKQRTALVDRKVKLLGIAWSRTTPAHVAALFADGTLWRKGLASGVDATTRLPAQPTSNNLVVTGDGTVIYAHDKELGAWRPSGSVDTLATLPKPIAELGLATSVGVIAFGTDNAAFIIDPTRPDQVIESKVPIGLVTASASADTGLMAAPDRGAIEMLDPAVGHHWTLASSPGITYTDPQISTDGRRVLALTARSLLVWSLDLPATADDTVAWLDRMTNAVADSGPGGLGWK